MPVAQDELFFRYNGKRGRARALPKDEVKSAPAGAIISELSQPRWRPKTVDPGQLAADLAALGYPGFAHLRKRRPHLNPGAVLLTALCQENLEARAFEALPWLVLKYWDLDKNWLVEQAKLHDLQNRLGFVVSLARKAGRRRGLVDSQRHGALEELESSLKRSLLTREEPLGKTNLSDAELRWFKKHRCRDAREWHLLTDWRPESLRYLA
jgi:hypothetical protein